MILQVEAPRYLPIVSRIRDHFINLSGRGRTCRDLQMPHMQVPHYLVPSISSQWLPESLPPWSVLVMMFKRQRRVNDTMSIFLTSCETEMNIWKYGRE